MLKNTNTDAQCHYSLFKGCTADPGYNRATCQPYLMQCYSTTAQQCSADAQCKVGKWGACVNASGGSLYCRRGASGCACTLATPASRPPLFGRVWTQPTSAPYIFPEQCGGVGTTLGLAYCGGGATSYTRMIGIQRALNRMAVHADYVSSSSGGSWFYGTYAFAAAKPAAREKLLGVTVPIAKITLDSLATTNKDRMFMGARLSGNSKQLVEHILEALFLRGMNISVAWQYGLGKVFLEYYGLNGDQDVMGSTLNTGLVNSAPAPDLPFWLCNSTLLHAQLASASSAEFLAGKYPPFVMTPMYVGIPQRVNLLRMFNAGTTVFSAGGGLVEPVLFNRNAPAPLPLPVGPVCDGTPYTVADSTQPRMHLRDYLATTSAAHAYVFNPMFQELATNMLKDLGMGPGAAGFEGVNIFPTYTAWSPAQLPTAPSVQVTLGDSGLVDNLNVTSLLARGVRKIISFVHEDPPYTRASTCMSTLKPLFGVYDKALCSTKVVGNATHVFPENRLDKLLAHAAETNATGGATYAVALGVPVLPNEFLGVQGGYNVDLMFVFFTSSSTFNSQLPAIIRSQFGKGGNFPNFPSYNFVFPNGLAGGIEGLTLPQVNLLSSYTDWMLTSIKIQVQNFLTNNVRK